MAKPLARESLHTEPSQVWAGLDTDNQRRALQLLAQMALNFLTGQPLPPSKEESSCWGFLPKPPNRHIPGISQRDRGGSEHVSALG
jgi:hypothetical protein